MSRPAARRYAIAAIGATFALSLFVMLSVPLGGNLRAPIAKNLEQIYYREGPVATIAVYETPSSARYVFVDQASVAGTSQTMLTDQKSLAHLPMCIVRDAKSGPHRGPLAAGGPPIPTCGTAPLRRYTVSRSPLKSSLPHPTWVLQTTASSNTRIHAIESSLTTPVRTCSTPTRPTTLSPLIVQTCATSPTPTSTTWSTLCTPAPASIPAAW